ncbi:phage holin family protein [Nocardioides sp. SYSU D00038]|uniref:phage holin family protein n=1 Tax=Nocardioides sp. SYSU D00038 TaxID=2812554 RepID=UPI001966D92D|nr:phage holin family protein [Nocardioides sp. SYSU D00038]
MRFVTWLVTTALGVAAAAWLVEGIAFSGPSSGRAEIEEKILPLLLVAVILGVVTSLVKPVLTVLSFPLIIVTLGLFLVVINAAMLRLTAWLADELGVGFRVDGWWPAIFGAVVVTLTTWVVDSLIGPEKRR